MSFGKGKEKEDFTPGSRPAGTSMTSVGGGRSVEAFLGKGSKIVGNLQFSGDAEIDGYVEGEIQSKGRLEVGEAAIIKAKIIGSNVVIRGTVTGDISASERLSIHKPARIIGNISSNNLSIEEGVVFEGTCSMKPTSAQGGAAHTSSSHSAGAGSSTLSKS